MIRVGPATTADVRELRHRVLRPDQPLGVLDSPDDDRSLHFAAWDDARVVGCVRILPAPRPREPRAWQLRGMAVDPAYQRQGIGRQLLAAAVAAARARQVPLLWANARASALGFYERAGWIRQGGEFLHAESGLPHYLVVLPLT